MPSKNVFFRFIRSIVLTFTILCPFNNNRAQSVGDSIRSHSFMLGVGSSHQLDTYLSPINYKGYQISLIRETFRMTRLADRRVSFQSLWQGTFSNTINTSGTASDLGGHIGYDALWHYNWTPLQGLRLMAGGAVGADVGFLYNSHGGNNPAQGRVCADISASVMAIYKFRLWGMDLGLRYQANMPVVGVMFSPQFGQSYYEISNGSTGGNVCFTHLANAFSLWQQFTVDIPLSKYVVIRTGYLCDIRQSHVNGIKVHDRSHSFMLGFVRHFRKVGREQRGTSVIL